MSPAPGAGPGSTIPALAFCTLPAYRHYNTFHAAAPQDSSIRCYIHCSTSLPLLHFTFVPAAAAPQFDGFREMAFTDQLVKPFVSHTGETGDKVHVDQGIIGTQKYAVVACCSQHGQNVPCEIYEDCANAGNLLSCAFRTGLLRDTRDYRRGNGLPDHTHLDDRGQNH